MVSKFSATINRRNKKHRVPATQKQKTKTFSKNINETSNNEKISNSGYVSSLENIQIKSWLERGIEVPFLIVKRVKDWLHNLHNNFLKHFAALVEFCKGCDNDDVCQSDKLYWSILHLVATSPVQARAKNISFLQKGLRKYVARSVAPSNDIKEAALLLAFEQKQKAETEILFDIFQLSDCPAVFLPFIKKEIEATRYDTAIRTVKRFSLQSHFTPAEILLPLLLLTKFEEIHEFLDGDLQQQQQLVSFLDKLYVSKKKAKNLIVKLNVTYDQIKRLRKYVEVIAKRFQVSQKYWPNMQRQKYYDKLFSLLSKKYVKNVITNERFEKEVKNLVTIYPDLKVKLVREMVERNNIDEAARYAVELKLPQNKIPGRVKTILGSVDSNVTATTNANLEPRKNKVVLPTTGAKSQQIQIKVVEKYQVIKEMLEMSNKTQEMWKNVYRRQMLIHLLDIKYREPVTDLVDEDFDSLVMNIVEESIDLQRELVARLESHGDATRAARYAVKFLTKHATLPESVKLVYQPFFSHKDWSLQLKQCDLQQYSPSFPTSGSILLVTKKKQYQQVANILEKSTVVAIQFTWYQKPLQSEMQPGVPQLASIEMATENDILIIDISKMGQGNKKQYLRQLNILLSDKAIRKLGFSLNLETLATATELKNASDQMNNHLDLKTLCDNILDRNPSILPYYKDTMPKGRSFRHYVELCLGVTLKRKPKTSNPNFGCRYLDPRQLIHAGTTVYCLIDMYRVLQMRARELGLNVTAFTTPKTETPQSNHQEPPNEDCRSKAMQDTLNAKAAQPEAKTKNKSLKRKRETKNQETLCPLERNAQFWSDLGIKFPASVVKITMESIDDLEKLFEKHKTFYDANNVLDSIYGITSSVHWSLLHLVASSKDYFVGKTKSLTITFLLVNSFKYDLKRLLRNSSEQLTNDMKVTALTLAFYQKHEKVSQILCDIFELDDDRDLYQNFIEDAFEMKRYDVVSRAVTKFKLQSQFTVNDILLPLYVRNMDAEIEAYIEGDSKQQQQFVSFLDTLCVRKSKAKRLIEKLNIPNNQQNRLQCDVLSRNVKRFVKKFNVPYEYWPNIKQTESYSTLYNVLKRKYKPMIGEFDEIITEIVTIFPKLQIKLVCEMAKYNDIIGAASYAYKYKIPWEAKLPDSVKLALQTGAYRVEHTAEWYEAMAQAKQRMTQYKLNAYFCTDCGKKVGSDKCYQRKVCNCFKNDRVRKNLYQKRAFFNE